MHKLKLDNLKVESFATEEDTTTKREGTVRGHASNLPSCNADPTCIATCIAVQTCQDTCAATCGITCPRTCDFTCPNACWH